MSKSRCKICERIIDLTPLPYQGTVREALRNRKPGWLYFAKAVKAAQAGDIEQTQVNVMLGLEVNAVSLGIDPVEAMITGLSKQMDAAFALMPTGIVQ